MADCASAGCRMVPLRPRRVPCHSVCGVAIEMVLLRLRRVPHGDRELHRDVESAPRSMLTEAVRSQHSSFGKT